MAKRDDHMLLIRMIAILISMAGLAEGSIGAPHFVRRVILHFLRQAEAVARDFLAGETRSRNMRSLPTPFDGSGPEDALRLASCFRAIALALEGVLLHVAVCRTSQAQIHQFRLQSARPAQRKFTVAPTFVFDTS